LILEPAGPGIKRDSVGRQGKDGRPL
jgi:hypothetical protein